MGFLIVNVVIKDTFPIDLPEADLILLSLDGDRERHNAIRGNTKQTPLLSMQRGELLYQGFRVTTTISGRLFSRSGMILAPRPRLTISVVFPCV